MWQVMHQDLVALLEQVLDLRALAVAVALLGSAAPAVLSLPRLAVLAPLAPGLIACRARTFPAAPTAAAATAAAAPAALASGRTLLGGNSPRAGVGSDRSGVRLGRLHFGR